MTGKRPLLVGAGILAALLAVYCVRTAVGAFSWTPIHGARVSISGIVSLHSVVCRGPGDQLVLSIRDVHGERFYVIRINDAEVVSVDHDAFRRFGGGYISTARNPRGVKLGKSAVAEVAPRLRVTRKELQFYGLYGELVEVHSATSLLE